jgi:hypothetical protein
MDERRVHAPSLNWRPFPDRRQTSSTMR